MNHDTVRGYLLAVLATIFWSFNVIIASSLQHEIAPAELTFWRWVVAAGVLLPFIAQSAWQHRVTIYANKGLLFALGVLGVSVMNTLIYEAAHTSSVIDIALLGTLGPIFLAIILRVFFNNKMTTFQTMGMGISFVGVVFIICHGSFARLMQFKFVDGDLYVVLRNIVFAAYTILLGYKPKNLPAPVFLGCTIFSGLLVLLGFLLWQGNLHFITAYSPKAIALIVYMGVFPSLISFLCWNAAIERLGAVRTSLIYYLIPLLSVVEAYYILNEMIAAPQLLGGVIVLGGIMLATVEAKHPVSNIHH